MKSIYTLFILTIVNLSFSQDSRIFENIWYLTNIIIDGNSNIPPNNYMNINFNSSTNFSALSCNTMNANVAFENNITNFSATNYVYTLEICTNTLAYNYQNNLYFPFFYTGNTPNPNQSYNFTYNITESSQGVRTLIINSINNQQAIYSSVQLSRENYQKIDFSLFPNPSFDFINFKINNNITENIIVEFYNEIGQICKSVNLDSNNSKIEVSDLVNGFYFVKIYTKNEVIIKKILKI